MDYSITLASGLRFSLPNQSTCKGLALAYLIEARDTNQLVFNSFNMTRLGAYIQDLENDGLNGLIDSKPMPLTKLQQSRKRSKPFHRYLFKEQARLLFNEVGSLEWAADTIELHKALQKAVG